MLLFHHATAALLGRPLLLSEEALRSVENREQALGIRFPASVREWYSLSEGVDILESYSNMDHPVALENLGVPVEHWHNTEPLDLVADGLMVFLDENQYVTQWAIRLNDTDDPEVVVRAIDAIADRGWRHCADHFSTFIYAQVWDWETEFFGDPCVLQAQDQALGPADLAFLKQRFKEGPQTFGWPGDTNYRFFSEDGKILIWDTKKRQADWMIWAPSPVALVRLAKSVWHCGSLSTELYALEECGETLLTELRHRD